MIDYRRLHRAQRRWLRRHAAVDALPSSLCGEGLTWRGGARERAKESRASKRRWRRRLSRARHTHHAQRAVIPFLSPPFGQGSAIGIYDGDPSGYPIVIRAPWIRGSRGIGIAVGGTP